jgi:RNA polymerase sigma factor (sigma-70 family)
VVLEAGAHSEAALEQLCRSYWYPVYSFIRRRGLDEHKAQDLTQEFFATLLSGDGLQRVSPERGKFRAFILAAVKHTLANDWRDANRLKRGGGRDILSWDGLAAEERYRNEPVDAPPEKLFDLAWAQAVVSAALRQLAKEMEREGVWERYDVLKSFLQGDGKGITCNEAAAKLGLSLSAVKSAILRMRRRYGELIRAEVASTIGPGGNLEEEIQHLVSTMTA